MAESIDQQRLSFYTFLSVLLLALGVALYMIAPYLVSLVMGGILAILARPLQRRLEARRVGPAVAASLVTASVIILVVGPLLTFSAVAIRQAVAFATELSKIDPEVVRQGFTTLTQKLPIPSDYLHEHLDDLQAQLQDSLREAGAAVASSMLGAAKSIPAGVLQLALACMACFFFLLDGPRFVLWIQSKIPLDSDVRDRLASSFKDTAISVVWASMAAAGTQAAIMWLAYLVLGIPAAFLAGGATFVFAWIPILGSTPVWIAGAIFLAIKASYVKVGLMVAFGVITGLVDNFVRPMVLKGRGEMHPLVSLVAIFGGLQMFGFFGVFFGPILAAVVITLLQVWPIVGRRWGLSVGGETHLQADEPAIRKEPE